MKRIMPSSLRIVLSRVKRSPESIFLAFEYLQMYGLKETWRRAKKYAQDKQNNTAQNRPTAVTVAKEYIVSSPVELGQTRLNIAVVVHAFHLSKIPEILNYISRIPYPYSLFFTVSQENKTHLSALLDEFQQEHEIIVCPNFGYDISPFLSFLPELKRRGVDLVCKIHTKKGAANLENHIEGIDDLWFQMIIESVLGSSDTIKKIIKTFEENHDVGLLGSADMHKSAQKLMYGNEVLVADLLNVLDEKFDPGCEWNFFAGSIFWARMDLFQPVLDSDQKLNKLFQDNNAMTTGATSSIFHAMERVFGALPAMVGMRTALSFALDIKRSSHAIHAPASSLSYCTPIGVGVTLQNEHYLVSHYEKLQGRSEFDAAYYTKETPVCTAIQMDPLLHFLRYGMSHNQAPNDSFSPFSYWRENIKVLQRRYNPLVHFVSKGIFNRNCHFLPPASNSVAALGVIKKSKLFDSRYYLKENPDLVGIDLLEHYCKYGWQEERRPGPGFDSLWYQNEYLRQNIETVNPLLHYLLIGKARGHKPKPRFLKKPSIQVESFPSEPKRMCLFAAYDPHGVIDETVVSYVKELSRHSDVYFLSDGLVQNGELEKLSPYVKKAWGFRHGEYDFGSYKRLAKYLVGWEKIAEYDEILLVNDSSYLLRPLDDVFAKMNTKKCSWWGLQATKGMAHTKERKSNQFSEKIPMAFVKEEMLRPFTEETECDFLVGSYFLAFRRPTIESGELQNILGSVKKERNKKNIILKNEVGLTRQLLLNGYDFDTYMDDLYPFHPIYTNNVFEMIKHGFPLFKRFFLTENHYHVPELWRWKEKLSESVPKADFVAIKRNLHRVSDAEKLHNNLYIQDMPDKLMNHLGFMRADRKTPKDKDCWAFPVCAYDHTLTGNDRAVFEEIKNDQSIKKVILFRSKHIELEGKNVHFAPLKSAEGQQHLLRSGVVFIKHTVLENVLYPLDPKRHKFINLWHGIPLKRIGTASLDHQECLPQVIKEHAKYHCVIASSAIDRMAMTAGFYPLTYNDIWVTGLPRNDFVLRDQQLLPTDFQLQLQQLNTELDGKKFILFAPTFRNTQENGNYQFSSAEKNRLFAFLEKNNIILGVREHMASKSNSYTASLQSSSVLNVSATHFPNIEVLYRRADLLITDYSSCFIDFMLTGKPMVSFAYDHENYRDTERGFFYDLDFVFPGPVCHDFDALLCQIEQGINSDSDRELAEQYAFKRKIFFDYVDDQSSARLVKRLLTDHSWQ